MNFVELQKKLIENFTNDYVSLDIDTRYHGNSKTTEIEYNVYMSHYYERKPFVHERFKNWNAFEAYCLSLCDKETLKDTSEKLNEVLSGMRTEEIYHEVSEREQRRREDEQR